MDERSNRDLKDALARGEFSPRKKAFGAGDHSQTSARQSCGLVARTCVVGCHRRCV